MSLWTWLGEGATLISLLSFLLSCALLVWSYRTRWHDQGTGRRVRRVNWATVAFVGACLAINLFVQTGRYAGRW